MSLATTDCHSLGCCGLFYYFDLQSLSFVVASSDETNHIKNIKQSPKVAGNILLETDVITKIQGIQFSAEMSCLEDNRLKLLYFKRFPYALALNPKLWQIKVESFKMTDNSFGFGKKIVYP